MGYVLMQFWGHMGLAVALTLASAFNALLLLLLLRRDLEVQALPEIFVYLSRLIIPLGMLVLSAGLLLQQGQWLDMSARATNGLWLFVATAVGAGAYMLGARWMRVPELEHVNALVRRKLTKE